MTKYSDMTPEEKRVYNAQKKRQSRAKRKAEGLPEIDKRTPEQHRERWREQKRKQRDRLKN